MTTGISFNNQRLEFSSDLNSVKYVVVDCLKSHLTLAEQISFMRCCKTLASLVLNWQIFSRDFQRVKKAINNVKIPLELTLQDTHLIRLFALAKVNAIVLPSSIKTNTDVGIQLAINLECMQHVKQPEKIAYLERSLYLIKNEKSPYLQLEYRSLIAKSFVQLDSKMAQKNLRLALSQLKKQPDNDENRRWLGSILYKLAKAYTPIKPEKIKKVIALMPDDHPKSVKFVLLVAKHTKSKKTALRALQTSIELATKHQHLPNKNQYLGEYVSILKSFRHLPNNKSFEIIKEFFVYQITSAWENHYLTSTTINHVPLLIELYHHYVLTDTLFAESLLKEIKYLFLDHTSKECMNKEEVNFCFKTLELFKSVDPALYLESLKKMSSIKLTNRNAQNAVQTFNKLFLIWSSLPINTNLDKKKLNLNLNGCIEKSLNLIDKDDKSYIQALAVNFLKLLPDNN